MVYMSMFPSAKDFKPATRISYYLPLTGYQVEQRRPDRGSLLPAPQRPWQLHRRNGFKTQLLASGTPCLHYVKLSARGTKPDRTLPL